MNKEEILAMEPGEKLDLLIGISIFSWRLIDTEEGYYQEPDGTSKIVEFNKYSTDISAAWQVVDNMCHPFRYVGLQTIIKDDKWLWEANIRGYIAICENAPEAICKAALIAKLGAKDE